MAHQRYVDDAGNAVDSVTTIIGKNCGWSKEALIAWARKLALQGIDPYKVKDSAAKAGTLAHLLIEKHMYGEVPQPEEFAGYDLDQITKAQLCCDLFREWEKENEVEYLEIEYAIQGLPASLPWKHGGCCDGVWRMWNRDKTKKIIALQDHKTGKSVYGDAFIQTCTYRKGIEFLGKYPAIDEVVLFHYDTANNRIVPLRFDNKEELDAGFEVFKGLCVAHNARKWIEKRIKTESEAAEELLRCAGMSKAKKEAVLLPW